jgi:UDP-glucose 4-epimerase
VPVPKNIYGLTKRAAENLCEMFQQSGGLPCIVLRTSRFFPEDDDNRTARLTYDDRLRASEEFRSPLARAVGSKGYHAEAFSEGPYPT